MGKTFVTSVIAVCVISVVAANPSAVELFQDIYHTCLQDFSISCAKPKALSWMSLVAEKQEIRITEDLVLLKKGDEEKRSVSEDIFDQFEHFIETHDLVAKVPEALRPEGPLGSLVPRSFQAEDIQVSLAPVETGRSSKLVKKVIVPFLLGLKFKTAVLVPLALALIALKTWKALTLGLLSLVLTGALLIFKLSKPKVNYEVVHFPQHIDHHVEHAHIEHPHIDHHHVDHVGWEHPGYGRQFKDAQEAAYNGHLD